MTDNDQFTVFKNVIIDTLVALGWIGPSDRDSNFYFVATKDYETAVGTKTAIAYFAPFFECMGKLAGDYTSEGRNILSTTWFNTDANMTQADVAAGAKQFAADVDAAVSGSYAVRVLRAG